MGGEILPARCVRRGTPWSLGCAWVRSSSRWLVTRGARLRDMLPPVQRERWLGYRRREGRQRTRPRTQCLSRPGRAGAARVTNRLAVARLFTIAGAESDAVVMRPWCAHARRRCPSASSAADQRLWVDCLDHRADGTILFCDGDGLLALGADGRMRDWPRPGQRIAVPLQTSGSSEVIDDISVASDGTVVVGLSVDEWDSEATRVSAWDVRRVLPDGTVRVLAVGPALSADQLGKLPFGASASVEALPDGAVLIGDPVTHRVLRVAGDGTQTTVAGTGTAGGSGDLGPATRARVRAPSDVVAFADGSFAFYDLGNHRVRRVDATGLISTLGGGSGRFHEGAPQTSVRLRPSYSWPAALEAGSDRSMLLATRRGVVRVDSSGRVHTVVRQADPGQVATDGRGIRATVIPSAEIDGIDMLPDGTMAFLTAPSALTREDTRVVLIAAPVATSRLAVALPGRDRWLANHGRVDVLSTASATARLTLVRARGNRVVDSRRVSLRRGRSAVRLRAPTDGDVYELVLRARASDGRIASHRLALIAGRKLARPALRRLTALVDSFGNDAVSGFTTSGCRQLAEGSWICDWDYSTEGSGSGSGRATYTLRRDGLIAYEQRNTHGRLDTRRLLEPQAKWPHGGSGF